MEIEYEDPELEQIANNPDNYIGKWSSLIRVFLKRVNIVKQAVDRRDLYEIKSNHLEKLKGDRQHQHSLCLNDQYRLIIQFKHKQGKEMVSIIKIVDYHP